MTRVQGKSSDSVDAFDGPKVETARYFMMFMYCMLSCMNSANWVSFAPISDLTDAYFGGIGNTAVNLFALIWSIVYGPGSALGIWYFRDHKLRSTLLLGGGLTAVGCLIRLVASYFRAELGTVATYSFFLLGQVLTGLAQPIIVNLAAAMASTWFPVSERDAMTTVATIFNPLGNAIGNVIPPMLVSSSAVNDDDSDYRNINGMSRLMLVQFIMALVPFLCACVFFRAAPKVPPSYSEAYRDQGGLRDPLLTADDGDDDNVNAKRRNSSTSHRRLSFGSMPLDSVGVGVDGDGDAAAAAAAGAPLGTSRGFREDGLALWNNRQYMLLLWSFSIGLGIVNAILTLIFQYVEPFGYSNEDAGVFGAVLIMGGVLGAGVAAYIMERTHAYGRIYSACFAACGIMVIFMCFMLYPNNKALLTLAFTLLGSTLVPIFPICLENCVETTYPISEDYSVGVLLSVANVLTVGITFAMEPLIDLPAFGPSACTPVNAFIVGLMGVGLYIAWQFKGDNKRLGTDQQGKADREARAARGGVSVPVRAPAPAPI